MRFTQFVATFWPLLIAYALIPVAPILTAFVLCRVDRRSGVRRMHYSRR